MGRWTALLLFAAFSSLATAQTGILFSQDGSKATITMLAFNANPDADKMFSTIAGPPVDINGKSTKRVDFKTADGAASFDLTCVFSKIVANEGSCILVLHASKNLEMEAAAKRARYELQASDAQNLAAYFASPADGGEVFRSSDNLLVIRAAKDSSGAVGSLLLTYGY